MAISQLEWNIVEQWAKSRNLKRDREDLEAVAEESIRQIGRVTFGQLEKIWPPSLLLPILQKNAVEVDAYSLVVVKNWANRNQYNIDHKTALDMARQCLSATKSVSFEQLDAIWATRSEVPKPEAAKPQPAAQAAPTAQDKQNIRTLLTMAPCSYGTTARFAGVTANEQVALEMLCERNLPVTVENFQSIFPKLANKLDVSGEWSGALDQFFASDKGKLYGRSESNIGLLENSLNGGDVTLENLLDSVDPNSPFYVGDKLALSNFGKEQVSQERQRKSDEAEKKQLVEGLSAHLTDAAGKPLNTIARGNTSPRRVLEQELTRLNSLPLPELRKMKETKDTNNRLRSLSPEQLRAEVRQNFSPQQAQQTQRYPQIPARYTPPGKSEECSVAWSPLLLKYLPKSETDRLMAKYGSAQLNGVIEASRKVSQ